MKYTYQIGSFRFAIEMPNELKIPVNFTLFKKKCVPSFTYHLSVAEEFPSPAGTCIVQRDDLQVYVHDDLEERYVGIAVNRQVYGCYREMDQYNADIVVIRKKANDLVYDTVFASLLALERHMEKDGLLLHCAYLCDYDGRAILFSAPSETGKSTQASLWEKYRFGSHQVNGDKAYLQRVNGIWIARGWPVCGSSEICHNEDTPIRTIVMLSQDTHNHCERMSPATAFQAVFPQITINRWNKTALNSSMDLLEQLISQVPFFHLGCTISEEAVDCLEETMEANDA